jgi:hypothetical protein
MATKEGKNSDIPWNNGTIIPFGTWWSAMENDRHDLDLAIPYSHSRKVEEALETRKKP